MGVLMKTRLVSVVILLFVIFTNLPVFAVESGDLSAISLVDCSVNFVGNGFECEFSILSDETIRGTYIVAVYDLSGSLMECITGFFEGAENYYTIWDSFKVYEGVEYDIYDPYDIRYKIMLWEDLYSLTPLCSPEYGTVTDAGYTQNYAYVLDVAWIMPKPFSGHWEFKLLTEDNDIQIFEMNENFKISDGLGNVSYYDDLSYGNTLTYTEDIPFSGLRDKCKGSLTEDPIPRLIKYEVNSGGYIKEISYLSSDRIQGFLEGSAEYRKSSQRIGSFFLADNTVVFDLSSGVPEYIESGDLDMLIDEAMYTGFIAKTDSEGSEYNCMVITSGAFPFSTDTPVSVVDSVGYTTLNNVEVMEVSYFTSGTSSLNKFYVTDETTIYGEYEFSKGDIVMFVAAGNNIALDVYKIASVDEVTNKYVINDSCVNYIIGHDENNEFIVSYIDSWYTSSNGRVLRYNGKSDSVWWHSDYYNDATAVKQTNANGDIVMTSDTNAYTYADNQNKAASAIVWGDWMADLDIDKKNIGEDVASYFFARVYNGEVMDIVVLGDRAAIATE